MKGRGVGKSRQDESGGYVPKWYGSVRSANGAKLRTTAVASPSGLRSGTERGQGGSQQPSGAKRVGTRSPKAGKGGYVPSWG